MIRSILHAKRVAFQGEPGAYANLAAREAIPHATAIPRTSFEDAIDAVKAGDCDLCIIPVENSLMGRIADIHHLLPESGLHIVGEHFLPIRHQLLGLKSAKLADVTEVYSQAPALAQCRNIVRERKLTAHNWYDTAGSAKHVAELKDPKVAAIASTLAGELYGLKVLKADVEDEHHNMTRFLIMAKAPGAFAMMRKRVMLWCSSSTSAFSTFRPYNSPARVDAIAATLGSFSSATCLAEPAVSYQLCAVSLRSRTMVRHCASAGDWE